MSNHKFLSGAFAKPIIAGIALSTLAVFAGSKILPGVSFPRVVLFSVLGALALFLILTAATILTLTVMQFVLRKGGTDSRWFWFASEPPGLVRLRAQAREVQE